MVWTVRVSHTLALTPIHGRKCIVTEGGHHRRHRCHDVGAPTGDSSVRRRGLANSDMRGASPHQRGRPQRVVLAQAASPINYSSARQRMAERLAHCRTFRVPWLSFRSPAGVSLRPANDSWQHRSFVRKLLVWEALDRLSITAPSTS
ncbi:hypothetical protein PsYK624_108310 [Phanerochaete sordida]|uniref:Uncharacterized protein n=1 Tax=Phanerochaete sordida TaxID=48140 RepID=A0A9P3LGU0_9APHY|nr:hypothetical protein PsYK624_108310 [Phanerochaete sordida]